MPVVLEKKELDVKDSVGVVKVSSTSEQQNNSLSIADSGFLIILFIVFLTLLLAKPFLGAIFFVLRLGLIALLVFFGLVFLTLM